MGGFQQLPGFTFAFLLGVLSFFSPCVLPLIPGYISFMSGVSIEELEGESQERSRLQTLMPVILCSLAFIVGLSVVYLGLGVLGALASKALITGEGAWGQHLAAAKPWLIRFGGLVIVVLGIHMSGLFRIKALYREKRVQGGKGGTIPRAFVLGVAFAFGWAPCTGPMIGALFTYAATRDKALLSFLLMAVYTLGLAIPIFLTAIAAKQFFAFFDRMKKYLHVIEIASGVLLIVVGLIVMFPLLMNKLTGELMKIAPGFIQDPESFLKSLGLQ